MRDDTWADLADRFADEAYASVQGRVRTHVIHEELLEHRGLSVGTARDAPSTRPPPILLRLRRRHRT